MNELDAEIRDKLLRHVRRIAPFWLREQCDDLAQMAAMKLMRTQSDHTWNDGFLSRVAYSVVIDEIRRRRRRAEVGMSPSMPDRLMNSAELSPDTIANGAQVGEALLACIAALPPDKRRAVTLYLQDHSVPEIASLLGFEPKKTSNLVYRGLGDLRDALRARGIQP